MRIQVVGCNLDREAIKLVEQIVEEIKNFDAETGLPERLVANVSSDLFTPEGISLAFASIRKREKSLSELRRISAVGGGRIQNAVANSVAHDYPLSAGDFAVFNIDVQGCSGVVVDFISRYAVQSNSLLTKGGSVDRKGYYTPPTVEELGLANDYRELIESSYDSVMSLDCIEGLPWAYLHQCGFVASAVRIREMIGKGLGSSNPEIVQFANELFKAVREVSPCFVQAISKQREVEQNQSFVPSHHLPDELYVHLVYANNISNNGIGICMIRTTVAYTVYQLLVPIVTMIGRELSYIDNDNNMLYKKLYTVMSSKIEDAKSIKTAKDIMSYILTDDTLHQVLLAVDNNQLEDIRRILKGGVDIPEELKGSLNDIIKIAKKRAGV